LSSRDLPVKTSQSAVDGPLLGVVAWDIKTEIVKKGERERSREREIECVTNVHTHHRNERQVNNYTLVAKWMRRCRKNKEVRRRRRI